MGGSGVVRESGVVVGLEVLVLVDVDLGRVRFVEVDSLEPLDGDLVDDGSLEIINE